MRYLFLLLCILTLVACGQQEDQNTSGDEVPAIIEAVLEVPEQGEMNEKISVSVTVTQSNEPVEDANEVKFEIWSEGKKDSSELIEANHEGEGKYTIVKTFDHEGIYHVQSHITARGMHTMPKASIQIGDVVEEEHEHEHEEEHKHESESSHHHHGDVSIALLKSDHIHLNEETELTVQVEKEDAPLNDAVVKLEIHTPSSANPEWIEAKPPVEGKYSTPFTFTKPGSYKIIVHINNDEGLHEHIEETIEIH